MGGGLEAFVCLRLEERKEGSGRNVGFGLEWSFAFGMEQTILQVQGRSLVKLRGCVVMLQSGLAALRSFFEVKMTFVY